MPDIDASIDRLEAALLSAGFERCKPPESSAVLGEIAEAVRPHRLPAALVRFWERVDPSSIAVMAFPEPAAPSFALELHRLNGEPEVLHGAGPPLLFPIAYSSHEFASIELTSEWGDGGTIFRWAWDAAPFSIAYHGVADMIDTLAELVEEGSLERRGDLVLVPIAAEEAKRTDRLDAAGAHPVYGDARQLGRELEAWPAHWLESSGIDLRDRVPVGATHTIAALIDAAGRGPVRGRIAGTVTRLVGFGGDTIALVDDGTAAIDVWCPAGTSPWGPGHRRRFEFELTVEGPVDPPPDFDRGHAELQRHALAGRLEDAQAAAEELFGRLERHRPAAVAMAIRPLE